MTPATVAVKYGVQVKEVSEITLIPRPTLDGMFKRNPERFEKMCELAGMYKRSQFNQNGRGDG